MTNYEQRALEHLDEATTAAQALTAVYAFEPVDFARAGALRSQVKFHLDIAHVYAELASLDPIPFTLATDAEPLTDEQLDKIRTNITRYARGEDLVEQGRETAEALRAYEQAGGQLP